MQKLADKTTSDGVMMLKDLIKVVEVLGTAGDWYQGGVTDLRVHDINTNLNIIIHNYHMKLSRLYFWHLGTNYMYVCVSCDRGGDLFLLWINRQHEYVVLDQLH